LMNFASAQFILVTPHTMCCALLFATVLVKVLKLQFFLLLTCCHPSVCMGLTSLMSSSRVLTSTYRTELSNDFYSLPLMSLTIRVLLIMSLDDPSLNEPSSSIF
jgi:hypothetical protein